MLKSIATIAGAVTAICGIIVLVYKHFLSPAARRKKRALKEGEDAVDNGDVSGITSAFDKLRRRIPIILLLLIAGCPNPKVVLHPIEPIDIIRVKQGQEFEAPKDGYFLSDKYLKDVMEAKVQ